MVNKTVIKTRCESLWACQGLCVGKKNFRVPKQVSQCWEMDCVWNCSCKAVVSIKVMGALCVELIVWENIAARPYGCLRQNNENTWLCVWIFMWEEQRLRNRKNGWGLVWGSVRGCSCVCMGVCVSIPRTSRKSFDSYYSSLAHRFRDWEWERKWWWDWVCLKWCERPHNCKK